MSIERARTLVDRIYNDSDSIMDPGSLIDELGSLCREDAEVRELMVKTLHERTKIGAYGSLSVAKRLMMVSLARTQNPAMSDELGKQLMLPDDGTSTEVWEIRDGAAFALGRLGCKEAVPVLEKAAEAGHAYQACRDALKKLREGLVEDPKGWKKAVSGSAFKKRLELSGDRLVRPPRGFDPEHPLIEDLKWKDYVAGARLSQEDVLQPNFIKEYATYCRAGLPFMSFLCGALDLPF